MLRNTKHFTTASFVSKYFHTSSKYLATPANDTTVAAETQKRGQLIFVTLVKSACHQQDQIQRAVKALMLKKTFQTQVHRDSPTIRGLIYRCKHLLRVRIVATEELFPEGTPLAYIKE